MRFCFDKMIFPKVLQNSTDINLREPEVDGRRVT